MLGIIKQQAQSTRLVMQNAPVKNIFVDGGFVKNEVFMNLLAAAFPHIKVYAAIIAQASAIGAAIAVQKALTNEPLPEKIISIKYYQSPENLSL